MLIPVNDQFRIKSDSMQWMIQTKRSREGKPSWESRLFFPTLQGAINELGELMVRESQTQTLSSMPIQQHSLTASQTGSLHHHEI